jgi:5-formyltetrahydrofolate cyclo-ligase
MATPDDINAAKRELRVATAERRRHALLSLPRSGEDLRFRFLTSIPTADHDAISAFWPLSDELDTRPLINALAARGHRIGLPVVISEANRCCSGCDPGTELVRQFPGDDARRRRSRESCRPC